MQILGLNFFTGDVAAAVDRMWEGGLVVAPSGPGLAEDLVLRQSYRDSVANADIVLPDSGAMVLFWNLLGKVRRHGPLQRLSGLAFLRGLFADPRIRERSTFWVMPSERDAAENCRWLESQGVTVPASHVYIAPAYPRSSSGAGTVTDSDLLQRLETLRPQLVVLNVGGGIQEPLGYYLKQNAGYRPAILCTGAAIAFLTGRQAAIPPWADRYYLGWLLRTLRDPLRFGARYLRAMPLFVLIWRYGSELPPLNVR